MYPCYTIKLDVLNLIKNYILRLSWCRGTSVRLYTAVDGLTPVREIKYFLFSLWLRGKNCGAALSFTTQHAISREFGGKWEKRSYNLFRFFYENCINAVVAQWNCVFYRAPYLKR